MNDNLKVGKLFVHHPYKSKSQCKIFTSKVPQELEEKLGMLFGIIEIDSPARENEELIDIIIETLEKNYYYTSLKPDMLEKNIESIFETALQKVNKKLSELIQNGEIILDIGKFNVIMGILQKNKNGYNVYFTQTGATTAFLIHKIKGSTPPTQVFVEQKFRRGYGAGPEGPRPEVGTYGASKYSLINVLEAISDTKTKPNPLKIFSNIISGKLARENFLLFSTISLIDYISLEKIKKTITTLSLEDSIEHLKNLLEGASPHISFAALLIKLAPEKKKIEVPSLVPLPSQEKKAEKFLTPSLNLKKYLLLVLKYPIILLKKISRSKQASLLKKICTSKKLLSFFLFIFSKCILFIKKAFILVISFGKNTFYFITSSPRRKKISQKTIQNLRYCSKSFSLWFRALPKSSKTLFISSIILGLLFLGSITSLVKKQTKEREIESYNGQIVQIQELQDAAEASLIYNNEGRARKFLGEAEILLQGLPKNSEARKEKFLVLEKEIEAQLEKIRHLKNISQPLLIADLATLSLPEEPKITFEELIELRGELYSYNPSNNNIYKLNLENKNLSSLNIASINIGHLAFGNSWDNNTILFYHTSPGLAELNIKENVLKPLNFTPPSDTSQSDIKDVKTYTHKLYLLDAKGNQIYRHLKISGGFANGNSWLKEKDIDLSLSLSMTIDGDIYVLQNNGQIFKFFDGYKKDFNLPSETFLELMGSSKIFASPSSDYLYLINPTGKKLVVLDKRGKLIIQYYSDEFEDLKDFVVLENEKKIYLLSGTKIYGIAIQHLK